MLAALFFLTLAAAGWVWLAADNERRRSLRHGPSRTRATVRVIPPVYDQDRQP